jgi:hypothetical protein
VNNLENSYKEKGKNYQNYQTPTSQITSINFSKPFVPNQPHQTKFPANNQNSYQRRDNRQLEEQLPPLPITLKELYAKLLSIGQIAPLLLPHMQPPFPTWYNPELTYEYHAGNTGHNIENCVAFKNRVSQLIKIRWVTFEDSPNVNLNPLPKHVIGGSGVNIMEVGSKKNVLRVTMVRLYKMLVQSGHLEKSSEHCMMEDDFYPFHKKKGHHIDECIEFHQKFVRTLTLEELRIEAIKDNEEIEMKENRGKYRV